MGVTPSNHRQNLELPQINFLSGSSSYSTKAQTTSTIVNTVFGALLSVGTAAVAGKLGGAGGTEGTSVKEQPLTPEMIIQNKENQAKILKSRIDALNTTIQDLAKKTDDTTIKNMEDNVAKAKDELFGEKSTQKELALKIQQSDIEINTANTNLAKLTTSLNSANAELTKFTAQKANADALGDDPEAQARSKELDGLIQQKNSEIAMLNKQKTEEEAKKTQAEGNRTTLQNQNGENFAKVQLKLDAYNKAQSELTEIKTAKETNKKLLESSVNQKAELETQLKLLETEIQNAKNELIDQKGQTVRKKQEAGKDYTEANAKDGNWFSRTWQKTKGIFSKSEREEYKEMKAAHKDKKEALSDYRALGGTRSEIKTGEYKDRQSAESKAVDFCKRNTYYQNMSNLAAKFIRTNLDATDAEIKAHLDAIIKKQNE